MIARGLCLFLLLLSIAPVPAAQDALVNQLKGHPSPYLAMHGSDPVHWQLWSRATLEEARRLNRPLFISSGYFSCHWCHVMQRESYRDPKIADLLNRYFIPVKIDRELNPALDAHLIEFVELLRGQSGWPLNVFMTPDGYPIFGMTYVPRQQFQRMLEEFRRQWVQHQPQLQHDARRAMDEWRSLRKHDEQAVPTAGPVLPSLLHQIDSMKDELAGGFGQQSKFPLVPQLRALLYLRSQGEAAELDNFIRLTLDRMATQGLHDNLGGGFFRYVTDPNWQTPHYEKMLYDNAQLAMLYLEASKVYGSKRYRRIGLDTIDFMLRDMATPDGAFTGSFSAVDSHGREGFYYLWPQAQLKTLLNADEYAAVKAAWLGGQAADSEYGYLPRWQGSPQDIAKKLNWPPEKLNTVLGLARRKMLHARSKRELLPDSKVLAAWNGLALSALAQAYGATHDKKYQRTGRRLAAYLTGTLWNGHELLRAVDDNKSLGSAALEDYALVAQGLWDWSRVDPKGGNAAKVAGDMVRVAWQRYFVKGRWRESDTPLIPMLDGRFALEDGPLPSASAVISRLTRDDPALAADKKIHALLVDHLGQVRSRLTDSMFWYASYLALLPDNTRR